MATEVCAEMVANVVTLVVAASDSVAAGDTLLILESMKMEIPVVTGTPGVVRELHVTEGGTVHEGDLIALIDEN